jgi:hypothetical protein
MTVTPQALRVFATLQGLKGRSEEDVIDALLPFTVPVLSVMNGKIFEAKHLALGLNRVYGWNISTDIATVFQKRLEAKAFLKRPDSRARILIVDIPQEEISANTDQFSSEVSELVDAFQRFISELNDLLQSNRSRPELLDMLVKFAVALDFDTSKPSVNNGGELPDQMRSLETNDLGLSSDDRYLCARFVEDVSKNDPAMFERISRLASVGMLTEVVQDFVSPSANGTSSQLTLILDAPLALAAVGVSGKQALKDITLTIEAARSLGCKIVVLEDSCNEMARILKTTLGTDIPERYGPTHTAIVKREVEEDFVRKVKEDPEKALKNIGILVRQISLESLPALHQYFSHDLYEEFYGSITWRQMSPVAVEHDAIAMTLVCRIREGSKARDIFDNRYVFVTSNPYFSKLARRFSIEHRLIQERHCPPVVHQSAMATAAWLRTGFGATSEIPMAHLLAHCERILSVKKEVVQKAREVVRSYTPDKEQQFDLLLQDARSVTKLMDLTLGDEDNLTAGNIETALSEMRRATAVEVQEEYELKLAQQREKSLAADKRNRDQINKIKEQHDKAISESASQLAEISSRLDAVENEKREKKENERIQVNAIIKETIKKIRFVRAISIFLLSTIILLLALNQYFGWIDIDKKYKIVGTIIFALSAIALMQQFAQWPTWGLGSILNWYGRRFLQRRIERQGLVHSDDVKRITWEFGCPSLRRD